jgi:hypothetical protein
MVAAVAESIIDLWSEGCRGQKPVARDPDVMRSVVNVGGDRDIEQSGALDVVLDVLRAPGEPMRLLALDEQAVRSCRSREGVKLIVARTGQDEENGSQRRATRLQRTEDGGVVAAVASELGDGAEREELLAEMRRVSKRGVIVLPPAAEDVGALASFFESQGDTVIRLGAGEWPALRLLAAALAVLPEATAGRDGLQSELVELASRPSVPDRRGGAPGEGGRLVLAVRGDPGLSLRASGMDAALVAGAAATVPVVAELARAGDRAERAQRELRRSELAEAVARRQLEDLSGRLGETVIELAHEQRKRQQLERRLAGIEESRAYRLVMRQYLLRKRIGARMRSLGRALTAPFRAAGRGLRRATRAGR